LFGIEHFGVAEADRYSAALMEKIESAAANPSFGADYDFVRSGLRRYETTSHAIYYTRTKDSILVLRILHGRMDPGHHLARSLQAPEK